MVYGKQFYSLLVYCCVQEPLSFIMFGQQLLEFLNFDQKSTVDIMVIVCNYFFIVSYVNVWIGLDWSNECGNRMTFSSQDM